MHPDYNLLSVLNCFRKECHFDNCEYVNGGESCELQTDDGRQFFVRPDATKFINLIIDENYMLVIGQDNFSEAELLRELMIEVGSTEPFEVCTFEGENESEEVKRLWNEFCHETSESNHGVDF